MSSSAIDAAIVGMLSADTQLNTLAPGGVFRSVSPQGTPEPYVIVDLVTHRDELEMNSGDAAYESALYLVKAVHGSTSGAAAQSAADRIHALLNNASLSVTGYSLMLLFREERIAYVEIDDNSDHRYQHRGGLYRVMVDPS
jgi:hypothetical protein